MQARTGPGTLDGSSSYNSTAESQSAKASQTDANMEGWRGHHGNRVINARSVS
jgi:hypothetical protein